MQSNMSAAAGLLLGCKRTASSMVCMQRSWLHCVPPSPNGCRAAVFGCRTGVCRTTARTTAGTVSGTVTSHWTQHRKLPSLFPPCSQLCWGTTAHTATDGTASNYWTADSVKKFQAPCMRPLLSFSTACTWCCPADTRHSLQWQGGRDNKFLKFVLLKENMDTQVSTG